MLQPRIKMLPDRIPILGARRAKAQAATTNYFYETRVGVFSIVQRRDRWHAMFEGESLGSYATPQQAADDLAGGHTFSPGRDIDTSTLRIPADINEWSRGTPP
jgi:hypothetical protein